MARQLQAPVVNQGPAYSLDGPQQTVSYKVIFYSKEAGIVFGREFVESDFSKNNFSILLGWSFLSLWDIRMNKNDNLVLLNKT